jgi:glycosyltransferase involved in cell wall biosynthesis
MIALLGRRDTPTDALEDYCVELREGLRRTGRDLELVRVPWREAGWSASLRGLVRASLAWRGRWVLLQYTALSWSRRGVAVSVPVVLAMLKRVGCRPGIVFHDPAEWPGRAWWNRPRLRAQRAVMRASFGLVERSIHTVPPSGVAWLPAATSKAAYIPVGSNVPPMVREGERRPGDGRTVVVFGVTGGEAGRREVADIAFAVRRASCVVRGLRLVVVGRGSSEAGDALREALDGCSVSARVRGLLPPEEVARELASSDAQLFVRGPVSTQRGSAIAGIACGLAIVGYSGDHTGPPLTEAGVALVPLGDRKALAEALVDVLTDDARRASLRARSREAHRRYFSWDAIAARYVEALSL